jgi:hypothetical protein
MMRGLRSSLGQVAVVAGVSVLTAGCSAPDPFPARQDLPLHVSPAADSRPVVAVFDTVSADPFVAEPDSTPLAEVEVPLPETSSPRPRAQPLHSGPALRFERPAAVRGLYVNAWAAGARLRMDTLFAVADSTEVNAFVVDIKDASGFVSHASVLPGVREVGADGQVRVRDLVGLLKRMKAAGLYPIARIVVAKDPVLADARPEWTVRHIDGGSWGDARNERWLNLWVDDVRDYHVALALEVAELGFPEVQWDYIRFPDAPADIRASARFPGAAGTQAEAVERFLSEARAALGAAGVRSTADVFGVTTSARHDVGVGQVWDAFIDEVDSALPMVYPSHFTAGSHGVARPDAQPYEIVRASLRAAVERNRSIPGSGSVIPWLQDFTRGSRAHVYGPAEVRAQIQATYDAGLQEWVLWNSGSQYTVGALEPVGGWTTEPDIRVGGRVVPVSKRGEVLNEVEGPGAGQVSR